MERVGAGPGAEIDSISALIAQAHQPAGLYKLIPLLIAVACVTTIVALIRSRSTAMEQLQTSLGAILPVVVAAVGSSFLPLDPVWMLSALFITLPKPLFIIAAVVCERLAVGGARGIFGWVVPAWQVAIVAFWLSCLGVLMVAVGMTDDLALTLWLASPLLILTIGDVMLFGHGRRDQ